ncbi:MAG: hypothetical protein KGH79_01195 [Patescibacteria group bacterium]|nr:hypothetical protein [Patescibacteria group bacterium]
MTELRIETNPSDEKLREHLLPDDLLRSRESEHPGEVRVLAVNRYQARLQARTFILNFLLQKRKDEVRTFSANASCGKLTDIPTTLRDLAWHRAAEAMLAIRKGHVEYRRNRRLRAEADAA